MYVHSMDRSDSVRPNHGFKDYVGGVGNTEMAKNICPRLREFAPNLNNLSARIVHSMKLVAFPQNLEYRQRALTGWFN